MPHVAGAVLPGPVASCGVAVLRADLVFDLLERPAPGLWHAPACPVGERLLSPERYPAHCVVAKAGELATLDDRVGPGGVSKAHDRGKADGKPLDAMLGVDPFRCLGKLADGHAAHDEPHEVQFAGVERACG